MSTSADSWWFTLFLAAGTGARLTRLITTDKITKRLRIWLIVRAHGNAERPIPLLFRCPWCMGFWVSCAVTACAVLGHGRLWFVAPALALTVAQITGMITASED